MARAAATTLVDSNILIDVLSHDPNWADASEEALAQAREDGALVINTVIYSEVSVGYPTIEQCEAALSEPWLERREIPWPAAFLAGKVFSQYRRRGGERRSPLPDFFIGAHAAVAGMRLLTRDHRRYTSYFPRLEVTYPREV